MPELIKDGPYIPDDLMNLLEDEKVAILCGAGVSVPTGLPSFPGLVRHIYDTHHITPNEVELELLDLPLNVNWQCLDLEARRGHHPRYDKVLEQLDHPERLGRKRPQDVSPLRKTVVERLKQPAKGRLDVHRALLTLGKTERGVRLVTTNFDHRFQSAARSMGLSSHIFDAAPKLPVPKFYDWHSIVHLHGCIDNEGRGDDLVLTSADFGRAYVNTSEGWAARFVTELFRNFQVVFVGYSLNDPVMTYLVDALDDENRRGSTHRKAFAFAACDGTPEGIERAERSWSAKNVLPITYDARDQHRLLSATLIEWARIREDPFGTRTQLLIRDIQRLPDGPATRNVVWALSSEVAAQALADEPPITDPASYPKLIAWLVTLWDKGAFTRPISQEQSQVPIFGNEFQMYRLPDLDRIGRCLCVWVANHMHVPEVLGWVLSRGGHLHPYLRDEARSRLANKDLAKDPARKIDPRLRLMWTTIVNYPANDLRANLWFDGQSPLADKDEKALIARAALSTIAPRLIARPGPADKFRFRGIYGTDDSKPDPIEECVHLELVFGGGENLQSAKDFFDKFEDKSPFANLLTDFLLQSLQYLKLTGDWIGDSSWDRPSISSHRQNDHREKWTVLIDWARDAYQKLLENSPDRALALIERWIAEDEPLLDRLGLHAITESPDADTSRAVEILLRKRANGLWSSELRRETFRFLRIAGIRLPRGLRAKLVDSIVKGPAYGRKNAEDSNIRSRNREIGLRLGSLKASGVKLNKKADALALPIKPEKETRNSHSHEFASWIGEVETGGWSEGSKPPPKRLTTKRLSTRLEKGQWAADKFLEYTQSHLLSGLQSLLVLAKAGQWPIKYWSPLLERIERTSPDALQCIQGATLRLLSKAPDVLLEQLGTATSRLLRDRANKYGQDFEDGYRRVWTFSWSAIQKPEFKPEWDRMTQALNDPIGYLAQAALSRLWVHAPEAGKGFPRPAAPYFDAIRTHPHSYLARIILVQHLNNLYLIDSDWTSDVLIQRMADVPTQEADDLWTAYGYSPYISPSLLQTFKIPFFKMLKRYDAEHRTDDNLVSMFVSVCLDLPKELKPKEIQGVVDDFPEWALCQAVHVFESRLRVAKEQKVKIWRRHVFPWLTTYWPQTAVKNTENTSEALLRMVLETGDSFPEASGWAIGRLKPIRERGYYLIAKSEFPKTYPDETFQLLDAIVPDDGGIQWERSYLKESLDAIRSAKAALGQTLTFQRLYRIANR